MFRFVFVLAAIIPFSFSQSLPALRWVQQIDNLGADTLAGLGTDAQGNIYIAGTTLSPNFPVKSAAQSYLGSAGVYRIDGPGSAYARLALNSVLSHLAADPRNPNIFYGTSSGAAVKSVDGGNSWSPLPLPSTQVQQFLVDSSNDQIVYAAAFDTGFLKSADGGATWNLINNGITQCSDCGLEPGNLGGSKIWANPNSATLFAYYGIAFARSTDGGASWQTVGPSDDSYGLYFDTPHPGVLYLFTLHNGALKSLDDGQTFQNASVPVNSIYADPSQSGRLLGNGSGGIFESLDDGVTWTQRLKISGGVVAADWGNGFLYASAIPSGIVQISTDLKTTNPIGPAGVTAQTLVLGNGHIYVPNTGGHNSFVTKLDATGAVVYSTYFGGSGDDMAVAIAVDRAGNVYVTGRTSSLDFPATKGAYANAGNIFLYKLNPDGSVGYSTYFPGNSVASAIAVDGTGAAYLTGYTNGNLPTTPGAYQTVCGCLVVSNGFFVGAKPDFIFFESDAFLTKFDPTGSYLIYSTYLGVANAAGKTVALASDGSAYLASGESNATTVYHMNATGSSLLATGVPTIGVQAMAIAADGSVYTAGSTYGTQFQSSSGAFETTISMPSLPTQVNNASAIVKMDAPLQSILAATYFGESNGPQFSGLIIDAAGNIYVGGGGQPHGLPTRTQLFGAFGPSSGFLSELSSDLSTLLFSTYLGDTQPFGVSGVAMGSGGSIVVGGTAGGSQATNVFVNSLTLAAPPPLRIDAIDNIASMTDGPLSPGETIVVQGAGFGGASQLMIGDATVPALSVNATQITAVVPSILPNAMAIVQVQSGGAASNQVLVPVALASPGLFSANGSGAGQGYILNQDGTLNTPSNPAKPAGKITIYATGVGAVSFTDGYAVTASPVSVFLDGFYCNGVAAVMGQIAGFTGSVYQLTVLVPNPGDLIANDPDLKNFTFPPLDSVILQIAGQMSQTGLAISIAW